MTVIAKLALALCWLALGSATASAHVGLHTGFGLIDGIAHPLTGADHVLAALAVGLWASRYAGRASLMLPLTFVAAMAAGTALGFAGLAIPNYEAAIVASLVVFGLAIASGVDVPLAVAVGACGLFALAHGSAHGAEIPAGISPLAYLAGLLVATGTLHGAGLIAGRSLSRGLSPVLRASGLAIAIYGVVLAGV